MSHKLAKKFRKEIRKSYEENFGKGMKMISNIIRRRPAFIPKFIWIAIYIPLFKFRHLGMVYKNIE